MTQQLVSVFTSQVPRTHIVTRAGNLVQAISKQNTVVVTERPIARTLTHGGVKPIVVKDTHVRVVGSGLQGPKGRDGSRVDYDHIQSSPSAVWTVNHNLGFKPAVELRDEGGEEYDAEVLHIDTNQLLVYHDDPSTGIARCT